MDGSFSSVGSGPAAGGGAVVHKVRPHGGGPRLDGQRPRPRGTRGRKARLDDPLHGPGGGAEGGEGTGRCECSMKKDILSHTTSEVT